MLLPFERDRSIRGCPYLLLQLPDECVVVFWIQSPAVLRRPQGAVRPLSLRRRERREVFTKKRTKTCMTCVQHDAGLPEPQRTLFCFPELMVQRPVLLGGASRSHEDGTTRFACMSRRSCEAGSRHSHGRSLDRLNFPKRILGRAHGRRHLTDLPKHLRAPGAGGCRYETALPCRRRWVILQALLRLVQGRPGLLLSSLLGDGRVLGEGDHIPSADVPRLDLALVARLGDLLELVQERRSRDFREVHAWASTFPIVPTAGFPSTLPIAP